MDIKEQRKIIVKAFDKNKPIESKRKEKYEWIDCPNPLWDWDIYDYRIKKDIDYMVEVMRAHEKGDKIQQQLIRSHECLWVTDNNPSWNWEKLNYRVKEDVALPCPFCGEPPKFEEFPNHGFSVCEVKCSNDGCIVSCLDTSYSSKKEAIKYWNGRSEG